MSTETELAEVPEEENTSQDKDSNKNQYRILGYFKEHTGLLVTIISALVGIVSFVLHFTVNRMNYVYLTYWGIPTLHANTNNQNELDMVFCALIYMLALILIQVYLSKTMDVYRYYNRFLSMVNQNIKISKRENKCARRKLREYSKLIEPWSGDEDVDPKIQEMKDKIDKYTELTVQSTESLRGVKRARRGLVWWIIKKLTLAFVLSCFIGWISLFLLNVTVSIHDSFRLIGSVIVIVVFHFLSYFLPAFFGTWRYANKLTNEEVLTRTAELLEKDIPQFPDQRFMKTGMKSILTDKNIKFATVMSAVMTVILLLMMAVGGSLSAEKQTSFPIYTDGAKTYAVVYTSGSTRYMEEAVIQDGTITIDTTKQRIITSDDISYDYKAFENVVVIRNEDIQR